MSNSNGTRAKRRVAPSMAPLEQVFRNRRILLTGGTGFLGKVFLYLLLRHHPEIGRVYLLVRGDQRSSLNRFRREVLDSPVLAPLRDHLGARFDQYVEEKIAVVPGDITDPGLLDGSVEPFEPGSIDAVINSAGLVNFEASLARGIEVNASGVGNVVDFCGTVGAALMHISTCYVAGTADGHRFEDDIPENWCPAEKKGFNLNQEIADAIAAVARVEAESRDQMRAADLQGDPTGGASDADEAGTIEHRRKRWVEERLKEVARQRAQSWGWPNSYSYTKSLGEQLALAARDKLDVTVVRPSVIESALADPCPGWNQGVNTSAPLTYLAGRGYRFYPAKSDLVLDVIPVDTVAHAMIAILGALLLKRHKPIYQLGTSDRNPLSMRRLVELTGLAHRHVHGKDKGEVGWMARHFEATVVSNSTFELGARALPQILERAGDIVRAVGKNTSQRLSRVQNRLDTIKGNADLARDLVQVYRPFIVNLEYTFHCANVRDLYASLRAQDVALHPFAPDRIDWRDYWVRVHIPGLRRHIYPQLDMAMRTRAGRLRFRSLVELLELAAERFGSAEALTAPSASGGVTSISYRELRDRAHRAGVLLVQRGVKPGDRVLLISENSPDWVLAYFAIMFAGAVAVPIDQYVHGDELTAICSIAEPRAALVSTEVACRFAGGIREASAGIGEIELPELSRPFILGRASETPPPPDRKTLASIVFTSGTTGSPKGVMLTHGNLTAQVSMLGRVFSLTSEDTLLSLLPLHHTLEFTCGMLLPLASGASIAYPLAFDSKDLPRIMGEVRPTALIGVPSLWEAVHRRIMHNVEKGGPFFGAAFGHLRQFNRSLDSRYDFNLGSILFRQAHQALGGRLRLAVSGGSALPYRVAEFFNDIGIRLLEGYGLTEAGPVLSVSNPNDPFIVGSVGKPLNGIEIKLDRESNGIGEIIAQGPNITPGYYKNSGATEEVLREGWLHTGDLGRFDDQGTLHIVGRAKEVIVDSGGNHAYIEELEEVYGRSPYLKEIAIVGLKIAQSEQVAALAVPDYAGGESRRAVEDSLRADFERIASGLSPHKRLRILRFTDLDLPRTSTRKIKRMEVTETLGRMLASAPDRESGAVTGEVEPWLADLLAQISSEAADIGLATRLIEDLGLDSLAMAELAEEIAERAGRQIAPEETIDLRTVADLQRLASTEAAPRRGRMPSYARFAEPFTLKLPGPLRDFARGGTRAAQRALFKSWLRPRVYGRGNIPANRNVVVIANLTSHFDYGLVGYALGTMGDDLVTLAAKDYFFNTPPRRFLAANLTTLIPFDRERSLQESLENALAELAAGKSVLVFPEGTRSGDGLVHEFKSGLGYLMLRSRCDVLPVYIHGTHNVLGKGSLIPRRHPVEVRIGTVISGAKLRSISEDAEGMGAYRKIAGFLQDAVLALGPRKPKPAIAKNNLAKGSTPESPDTQSSGRNARRTRVRKGA